VALYSVEHVRNLGLDLEGHAVLRVALDLFLHTLRVSAELHLEEFLGRRFRCLDARLVNEAVREGPLSYLVSGVSLQFLVFDVIRYVVLSEFQRNTPRGIRCLCFRRHSFLYFFLRRVLSGHAVRSFHEDKKEPERRSWYFAATMPLCREYLLP